jgi:hypothetical protein
MTDAICCVIRAASSPRRPELDQAIAGPYTMR